MKNNAFDSLQSWYYSQCDGDWEHQFGIKIDTLDNPGWLVVIDLKDTQLVSKEFDEIDQQRTQEDWVQCEVKDAKFKGAGGPKNLTEIIEIFMKWANSMGCSLEQ